jgi:hypothetical protein
MDDLTKARVTHLVDQEMAEAVELAGIAVETAIEEQIVGDIDNWKPRGLPG